jgi:uncharacterized membrane protein
LFKSILVVVHAFNRLYFPLFLVSRSSRTVTVYILLISVCIDFLVVIQ